MSGTDQRRTPDGRFATGECPSTYRRIVAAFTPGPAVDGSFTDPANPQRTALAVTKCPHGSFPRYAARNCCREQ